MRKQTIAVINQKGGVGKTTTTVNLSAYLAKLGRKVLLIDFDPQGNSTSGLGIDKEQLELTSYEVIVDPKNIHEAVRGTEIPNLYILPSNAGLASVEVELSNEEGREYRLRAAVELADYDYVIIDCPPALGLLTVNALAAVKSLLIPVQAEYYAMEGLGQLLGLVQRARETINPDLMILGILMTMYDKRTTLADQVHKELKQHFKDLLFEAVIPRNVRLAEAPSFGKTIAEHDKWSRGARAYKQLAKEVDSRIKKLG
jgi:chromosome partitioning protein